MFKLDSPLMNFLNKVADIMILNFFVILGCLPIVTAGASLTAGYYVAFKMVKNEESYITKGYFKAFKENFKQSTIMWLIMLVVAVVLFADYRIMTQSGVEFSEWMRIAIMAAAIIIIVGIVFVFPMQARFTNTVKNQIKNSYLMALSHLPSAVLIIVSFFVPVVVFYLIPQSLPALVLLAVGLLIYLQSMLFLKIFRPYEERILAREAEEAKAQEDSEDLDSGIFAGSEAIEEAMKEEAKK
ncbi:MAG: DUF624 domain-containing protein [Lachnospiraceae bacterium]|nr:DUF624 domain-containing protein [Lachnospiraceae bacterium]